MHEGLLDEVFDRIALSRQIRELFFIERHLGVLSLPLMDLLDCKTGMAGKFLQRVQAVILDDEAHLEVAVHG